MIVLSPSLSQIDRNALLAHEIVHVERGIYYSPTTPAAVVEKEEHAVRRETAARLVPMDELIAFVDATQIVVPVRAEEVAERFQVPLEVAAEALKRMPAF